MPIPPSRDAEPASPPRITVVVPVHDGGLAFERCLASLAAVAAPAFDLVVVDDGSTDGSAERAAARGARIVRLPRRLGPAAARNAGAAVATSELLCFLDADCELHADALARLTARFDGDPGLAAIFGSYDDAPAAPGVVSRFKNLFHHWTHQRAPERARTFWGACGAIRRERFLALGGFDARRYPEPSVEDIELGYRLVESGGEIRLDRAVQVKHLKRWTLGGLVRTDVFRRGVPWTELLLERQGRGGELNVGRRERIVVAVGVLGTAALPAALWWPPLLVVPLVAALVLVGSYRGFYALVRRRAGDATAIAALPLHALYCCCCCAALAIGIARHAISPRRKTFADV